MNKSDLIEYLSEKLSHPKKKTEDVVNHLFDTMTDVLSSGGRIEIRGFGSFVTKDYEAYTGRNPRTGESIEVRPKKLPTFKVGKELRERVNGGPLNERSSGGDDSEDADDDM
ncbi:MAG: integration host factor subunit beta [Deltaproteobacteria bacterium]|nr:integration host factor subunit beta [Deltaproteobacteria bacterium]